MSYSCPICSDLLERIPQDPTNNKGASIEYGPGCGHLFHSFCINKWMSGDLQTNKQCPCCRKPIPNKRCKTLFPHFDRSSYRICNHEPEIKELQTKIEVLENQKLDIDESNRDLRRGIIENKKSLQNEQLRSEQWKIKCSRLTNIENNIEKLEGRYQTAEAQIAGLQKIRGAIGAVQTMVDEMGDYPATQESVDILRSMNQFVANELRESAGQKISTKKQQEHLRQANFKSDNELKALTAENRSLENRMACLEIELEELRSRQRKNVQQSTIKLPTAKVIATTNSRLPNSNISAKNNTMRRDTHAKIEASVNRERSQRTLGFKGGERSKEAPTRKRKAAAISTLNVKKEKNISDDSVIELTPEREDDMALTTNHIQ